MSEGTHIDIIETKDTDECFTNKIDSVIKKLKKYRKNNYSIKKIHITIKGNYYHYHGDMDTDTKFIVEY
jgi:hypothetical protein